MTVQHYLNSCALHAVLDAVIQLSLLQCGRILWTVLCNSLSLHVSSAVLCNADGSAAWLVCML